MDRREVGADWVGAQRTARFVSTRRPSTTWDVSYIAASASEECAKVTNPKPRERRVVQSRMTMASFTVPNCSK